jgi:hypothetical protein|tara:strand:- start:2320 stop:2517 length:198 start_codon:yes stop_codon:yes gene_type:complete
MWILFFLAAFIFLLTYDPKSGTLNKYVELPDAPCKDGHYQEVQFAQKGYQCPSTDKTQMGAIIST